MTHSYRRLLFATSALIVVGLAPVAPHANPLDGKVVGGAAMVYGQGTSQVTIDQSSSRAIIDWRSFNLAPGETTRFIQPNAASVTLNRVTGGLGPSQIQGAINANGGVYLVNPDGILFGPSATVNVGSFLGTTHNIANDDFMAGRLMFNQPGNPSASIVNQGTITAGTGGFAALVAPGVRNEGVITANLGTVALAAGNSFALDFYGDSLIKLQPSDAIAAEVIDVATGRPLKSLVTNTGTLRASGGKVAVTAAAARRVVESVINTSGVVEADTVGTQDGMIVFGAATEATKPAAAPPQTVKVAGRVSATGKTQGSKGGKIQITGEHIALANAAIDASGDSGGGTIRIGGDIQGGKADPAFLSQYRLTLQPQTLPTATTLTGDSTVTLDASAKTQGNGGTVVVWSEQATNYAGSIRATGGAAGGAGGFIETSSHGALTVDGSRIAAYAGPNGKPGTWLLDPVFDVPAFIGGSVDNSFDTNLFIPVNSVITVKIDLSGENTSGPTYGEPGRFQGYFLFKTSAGCCYTIGLPEAPIVRNEPMTVTPLDSGRLYIRLSDRLRVVKNFKVTINIESASVTPVVTPVSPQEPTVVTPPVVPTTTETPTSPAVTPVTPVVSPVSPQEPTVVTPPVVTPVVSSTVTQPITTAETGNNSFYYEATKRAIEDFPERFLSELAGDVSGINPLWAIANTFSETSHFMIESWNNVSIYLGQLPNGRKLDSRLTKEQNDTTEAEMRERLMEEIMERIDYAGNAGPKNPTLKIQMDRDKRDRPF